MSPEADASRLQGIYAEMAELHAQTARLSQKLGELAIEAEGLQFGGGNAE